MLSRRKLAHPPDEQFPVMTMGQPTVVPAVGSMSRSETRTVCPTVRPLTEINGCALSALGSYPELSVRTVLVVPAPKVEGVLLAVPEPVSVIGVVIERVPFQVQLPAGMTTVSPTEADATAFCTSVSWQVEAFTVLACATPPSKRRPRMTAEGQTLRKLLIVRCSLPRGGHR